MAIDEEINAEFGALVKQWVIGDTPPSEVKRRVNPLMYQDDRHCAIPAISNERLGYVEGTNAGSSTMFTKEYLDWMAKSYPWGNGLTLHLPVEGGGDLANYPDSVVVHEDSLIAGFRIPLALFTRRLLSTMELSPARVGPNSWKYFSAFAHHCVSKGFYPEYEQVCILFHCRGPHDEVFNFHTPNTNLIRTPKSVYGWRKRWFLVRQRGEYTLGFPLYSKQPKDFPRYEFGVCQRNLLKTVLELPILKKQAKVITDDLLESVGLSYPFKRTNQLESVDVAAAGAKKKKATKKKGCELNEVPQTDKGKRIAAEVLCSSEAKALKRTKEIEKFSENTPTLGDDSEEGSGPNQSDAVVEKAVDISSFPLQSLLRTLDDLRSRTVSMIQYDEMKRCFDELLEEISRIQVQVASQSVEVFSKNKERVCSKEKDKALSVLADLVEKLDTAMAAKVNAENQVKHLQKETEQRELEVHALTYDNGRLLEMVQELSQDNMTLYEKLDAAKGNNVTRGG